MDLKDTPSFISWPDFHYISVKPLRTQLNFSENPLDSSQDSQESVGIAPQDKIVIKGKELTLEKYAEELIGFLLDRDTKSKPTNRWSTGKHVCDVEDVICHDNGNAMIGNIIIRSIR